MKILALEFSSRLRGAAVLEVHPPAPLLLGHSSDLGGRRSLSLVEEALEQAACQPEDIDTLAVGLGPGSYTGIRGAIALAQGWQAARGVRLLGISTVECLAAQAQAQGMRGLVNIVIDAQRGEFYLAGYHLDALSGWQEVQALRLEPSALIQDLTEQGQPVLGPDIVSLFPAARDLYPEAAVLGRLASGRRDFVAAENLEPIYLRETAFKKAPPARFSAP